MLLTCTLPRVLVFLVCPRQEFFKSSQIITSRLQNRSDKDVFQLLSLCMKTHLSAVASDSSCVKTLEVSTGDNRHWEWVQMFGWCRLVRWVQQHLAGSDSGKSGRKPIAPDPGLNLRRRNLQEHLSEASANCRLQPGVCATRATGQRRRFQLWSVTWLSSCGGTRE